LDRGDKHPWGFINAVQTRCGPCRDALSCWSLPMSSSSALVVIFLSRTALPLLLLRLRRATEDSPSLVDLLFLIRARCSPAAAATVVATLSPMASIGRLLERRRMLHDRDERTEINNTSLLYSQTYTLVVQLAVALLYSKPYNKKIERSRPNSS